MIIDSHCHAWPYWPYQPPVPDPTSRGMVEQLLFEMEQNGVDRAVVVCARIEHNPTNNDYIAAAVRAHPERLVQFADVDCQWMASYQQPGAAQRLSEAVARYGLKGFTHYIARDDTGDWYDSAAGRAFFATAERLGQIASLSLPARLQPMVRRLATAFPGLTILCHHMAGARVADGLDGPALREILASAPLPNIHVKLSGFHYVGPVAWAYPYPECRPIVQALFEHFGPERLHWGSDYPVVRRAMTYQQSLEAVRTHCAEFIPPPAMARVLGDSLAALLDRAGTGAAGG